MQRRDHFYPKAAITKNIDNIYRSQRNKVICTMDLLNRLLSQSKGRKETKGKLFHIVVEIYILKNVTTANITVVFNIKQGHVFLVSIFQSI